MNDADIASAERDDQVRLWWDETPLDFFFDAHDFHREVAAEVRSVEFEGRRIPVIGCVALVVFKALYNRTRDWADVEDMLEADAVDREAALAWVSRIAGAGSPITLRLAALSL